MSDVRHFSPPRLSDEFVVKALEDVERNHAAEGELNVYDDPASMTLVTVVSLAAAAISWALEGPMRLEEAEGLRVASSMK